METLSIADLPPGRYDHGWIRNGAKIVLSLQKMRNLTKLDLSCYWDLVTMQKVMDNLPRLTVLFMRGMCAAPDPAGACNPEESLREMLQPLVRLTNLRELGIANLGCLAWKYSSVDGRPWQLPCRQRSDEECGKMRDYLQDYGVVAIVGQVAARIKVVRVQCDHFSAADGVQWTWVRGTADAELFAFDKNNHIPLDLFHHGHRLPSIS